MERQRGGHGFLGGPGEAQIETDRRLIQDRIDAIRRELAVVVRTRALHRSGRKRVPLPVAAIVGYTNAGKSTLFNRLTGAAVSAKDQVFETLDPTMRELKLPSGRRIVLSDTVGFISDLPTTLIAAFRATLEEVVEADLILHVRDISHAETEAQCRDVMAVLADLGIDAEAVGAPVLEVWNKADKLGEAARRDAERAIPRSGRAPVLVSALTGEGVEALRAAIDARLGAKDEVLTLEIPPDAGRLLSWLHANAEVLEQETAESGAVTARFRIDPAIKGKLDGQLKRAGLAATNGVRPLGYALDPSLTLCFYERERGEARGLTPFCAPRAWPGPTTRPSRRASIVRACVLAPASSCSMRRKRRMNFWFAARSAASGSIFEMPGDVGHHEQQVAELLADLFAGAACAVIAASSSPSSSLSLSNTGASEGQSKPTLAALSCNLTARVRAGRPTGTSSRRRPAPLAVVSKTRLRHDAGGLGVRGAGARSSALMRSQKPGAAPAARSASLPNTCGWRRIILAVMASTTSAKAKAPSSSAMRA